MKGDKGFYKEPVRFGAGRQPGRDLMEGVLGIPLLSLWVWGKGMGGGGGGAGVWGGGRELPFWSSPVSG